MIAPDPSPRFASTFVACLSTGGALLAAIKIDAPAALIGCALMAAVCVFALGYLAGMRAREGMGPQLTPAQVQAAFAVALTGLGVTGGLGALLLVLRVLLGG